MRTRHIGSILTMHYEDLTSGPEQKQNPVWAAVLAAYREGLGAQILGVESGLPEEARQRALADYERRKFIARDSSGGHIGDSLTVDIYEVE